MSDKVRLLSELRAILRTSLALQRAGAATSRLGRAQGEVDGYMRALLDAGMATQSELLRLVAEERATANGPALGLVSGGAGVAA